MQVQYQRYERYKDSGVPWLGEIPEGWQLKRLKYVTEIRKRIIGHEGPDVLSITQRGIKVKDVESGEGQLATDYSNYQHIFKGEFAMNHMDLLTGYVDLSKYDGAISPDYRVFANVSKVVSDGFLLLLFQLGYTQRIFFKYGQGVSMLGRWRFPANNFKNFLIPIPPRETQDRIVAFLDQKVGEIEAAIEKKRRLIELLNEQKAILINNAVTKGLNPAAPMKDSGIDWIGEIPAHWEVKKLKYLLQAPLKYGANEEAKDCIEGDPRYIRITDFADDGIIKEDTRRTLQMCKAQEYMLIKGDILLARSGATVGKSFLFNSDELSCFAGYLIRARAHSEVILPEYLYLYTKSATFTDLPPENRAI